jgi:hypothetical protein
MLIIPAASNIGLDRPVVSQPRTRACGPVGSLQIVRSDVATTQKRLKVTARVGGMIIAARQKDVVEGYVHEEICYRDSRFQEELLHPSKRPASPEARTRGPGRRLV